MKIRIENVRCLENCELALPSGSRTVLIGTNNAGKSSLLDVLIKSLWSLPGYANFSGEWTNRLGLSSSYYRRQGASINRPQVHVTISVSQTFPEEAAFPEQYQELYFSLAAS